jgi:hypothetical protein
MVFPHFQHLSSALASPNALLIRWSHTIHVNLQWTQAMIQMLRTTTVCASCCIVATLLIAERTLIKVAVHYRQSGCTPASCVTETVWVDYIVKYQNQLHCTVQVLQIEAFFLEGCMTGIYNNLRTYRNSCYRVINGGYDTLYFLRTLVLYTFFCNSKFRLLVNITFNLTVLKVH